MQPDCGESSSPDNCPDCGEVWSASERLHTGDDNGWGGWEDWCFCKACGCELFYPVLDPGKSKGNST